MKWDINIVPTILKTIVVKEIMQLLWNQEVHQLLWDMPEFAHLTFKATVMLIFMPLVFRKCGVLFQYWEDLLVQKKQIQETLLQLQMLVLITLYLEQLRLS